tara:strand:+ start:560 stop:784 length:225 start_codon:yes stop_codon:yes gene_type:complete
MSDRLFVDGNVSLVRDTRSNAIINTNKNEYELYMKKCKQREKENDVMRKTVKEINTLKTELFEIKSLLKKVLNK